MSGRADKNAVNDPCRPLLDPTIPGAFVFDALQAAGHRGLQPDALLLEAGLDPALAKVAGYRLSVVDYGRLIELVIKRLDDGFLGFLDQHIPRRAFSVFAAQMAACSNAGELIRQANRFFALFTRQFQLRVEEQGDMALIALEFRETCDFDYRFIYQSILLAVLRMMAWLIGMPVRPECVKFSFEKTDLDKYLQYLFDAPLEYSHQRNEILLQRDLLTLSCSTNLKQIDLMLRDSTRLMLVSDKQAPFSRRVRETLVKGRQETWPTIHQVAASMDLSSNLLWRKLKKENNSFLRIRDEVKRDYALSQIMNADLSISDLAQQSGFADLSSFNKAFKKWTGQAPMAYRKAALQRSY